MKKGFMIGLAVILLLVSTSVVLAIGGPTDKPTINIMTYNIRYGCGNDGVCTDFNTNVANIANIIESKNPDVVVLQETNKGNKKTFPILQQRLSGFVGKEFGTQAIFIRSNNQFVQNPVKHDLFSGRSYIRSVVAVRSIPYVIYQTHLTRPPQVNTVTACQPQSESRDFGKTLDEAAELNNALFGESLDSPVIITGDFNLPPDEINSVFSGTDTNELSAFTFPTNPYCDSRPEYGLFEEGETIDYVLVSDPLQGSSKPLYEGEVTSASDHFPLIAKLEFTGNSNPYIKERGATSSVPSREEVSSGAPRYETRKTETPRSIPGCSRCKELDQIWEKIRIYIGGEGTDKVWDTEKNQWRPFQQVYTLVTEERVQIGIVGPSGTASGVTYPSGPTSTVSGSGRISAGAKGGTETECFRQNFGTNDEKTAKTVGVNVGGKTFAVNQVMAPALREVAKVIERVGYTVHSGNSCRNGVPSCGNFHASCMAIDINPAENPYCPDWAYKSTWLGRIPSESEKQKCARGEIVTDIPQEIIEAFEANGFYWGGRFSEHPDPQHFEYIGSSSTSCCSRNYGEVVYSATPEDTFSSNPRCLYGKDKRGFCNKIA